MGEMWGTTRWGILKVWAQRTYPWLQSSSACDTRGSGASFLHSAPAPSSLGGHFSCPDTSCSSLCSTRLVCAAFHRGIVNGSGWEEGTENLISAYTLFKILKSGGECLGSWLWFCFFFFFLPRKSLTNEAFYDAYKTVLVARVFILSTFPLY